MRWFDRLMVGGLIIACVVLAVMFQALGRNVANLDDRRTPVTIDPPATVAPATVPPGWVVCANPDGTEDWTSTVTSDGAWSERFGVDEERCA